MMRDIIIPVLSFAICNCAADVEELELQFCKKQTTFRVTTFNIKNSIDAVPDVQDEWQNRREHVHVVMDDINSDIYGLQEVTEEQLEWLKEKFPEYDFQYHLHVNAWNHTVYDSVLMWKRDRFIIKESGSFWTNEKYNNVAPWVIAQDRYSLREYYIVNVHLGSNPDRREEFNLIKAKVGEYLQNKPVIVLGDFNATPEPTPWHPPSMYVYPILVNDSFLVDGYKTLYPKTKERSSCSWEEYCHQYGIDLRIDLVLLSREIQPVYGEIYKSSLNGRNVSDHYPVYLDLTLQGSGDTLPVCSW